LKFIESERLVKNSLILALFPIVGLIFSLAVTVQDANPDRDSLRDSLARINEPSVRATVSFLASNELGGRGTPSPGFTIASRYVASRFDAAGLEPGGIDGWYQNREIETSRLPVGGVTLRSIEGGPLDHFGLLAAGRERVEFSGAVAEVKLADEFSSGQFDGPVVAVETDPGGARRYLNNIIRATNRLKQAGATALLLVVPEDHPAIALAQSQAGKDRVANPGQQSAIPVLLVRELKAGTEISLSLPSAVAGVAVVRNTIGVLRGSDPELSQEAIVVTAHLDHLGIAENAIGDKIYNGADDDASGVTGVLTLADAFAALPVRPKRSIVFMTFWGEESGLLGSRQYADDPTWPLEKTVANVNIEMIGRPEAGAAGKIWMTGWTESDLGTLMADAAKLHGGTIFEHPKYSAMLYGSSDNRSFVNKGVIGHSFSAGSLHGDYHQLSDEWEKLETAHMTQVIQYLFHGIMPMANGEVTPKPSAERRDR